MLEHAVALFQDVEAYGTIFNNSAAVTTVAKLDNPEASIEVQKRNWISYYTGKESVFSADTAIGRVSANHTPVFTIGKDRNHGLEKVIELSIRFDEPLPVIESLNRMGRVLQFFRLSCRMCSKCIICMYPHWIVRPISFLGSICNGLCRAAWCQTRK